MEKPKSWFKKLIERTEEEQEPIGSGAEQNVYAKYSSDKDNEPTHVLKVRNEMSAERFTPTRARALF